MADTKRSRTSSRVPLERRADLRSYRPMRPAPSHRFRIFFAYEKEAAMSQVETAVDAQVVAVYPDHPSAEEAVRRLVKEGFSMKDISIVGRDFQVEEEPIGFVSARDFIATGAGTGAWVGGL